MGVALTLLHRQFYESSPSIYFKKPTSRLNCNTSASLIFEHCSLRLFSTSCELDATYSFNLDLFRSSTFSYWNVKQTLDSCFTSKNFVFMGIFTATGKHKYSPLNTNL